MLKDWKHSGFSIELVRRYGVYAGKVRKQWQERPSIYRLAPKGWQKEHSNKFPIVDATLPEDASIVEAPDAWSKLRKQSKVYEVDPFVCPKCQGTMSVVAISV